MASPRLGLPLGYRLRAKVRALRRRLWRLDDFDWRYYPTHYRAEVAANQKLFAEDLADIDVRVIDGKIYTRGHNKPLHPTHLCVWECILNLHPGSVAEIGMGGGRFLAGLRELLGKETPLSGYDVSVAQLAFFKELYPRVAAEILTAILDITEEPIPDFKRPDLVLASTVLMHIQRPPAYERALGNLLDSAVRYVVIMDNYSRHAYFDDLTRVCKGRDPSPLLYRYDTGRACAIVVALTGESLGAPFDPLIEPGQLTTYLR